MSHHTQFARFRQLLFCVFFLLFGFYGLHCEFCVSLFAEETATSSKTSETSFESLTWETDYTQAAAKAKAESKNLLVYFYTETDVPTLLNETEEKWVRTKNGNQIRQVSSVTPANQKPLPLAEKCRNFENEILGKEEIKGHLDRFIRVKLPLDTEIPDAEIEQPHDFPHASEGSSITVLDLPMFKEMLRHPGLAVVDFEHSEEPYYETVTGILPFLRAKLPTEEQTEEFLTLPSGTLSQRTLIYAMRIHPEKPLSTLGEIHPAVMRGATEHAEYQAKTGVLGHQNFGTRTAKIIKEIGEGSASEICAQSWSGEGLYEAAIGCVRAWRGSSGHWSIARKKHTFYGYDIVKGANDTWFAVGLFVD